MAESVASNGLTRIVLELFWGIPAGPIGGSKRGAWATYRLQRHRFRFKFEEPINHLSSPAPYISRAFDQLITRQFRHTGDIPNSDIMASQTVPAKRQQGTRPVLTFVIRGVVRGMKLTLPLRPPTAVYHLQEHTANACAKNRRR